MKKLKCFSLTGCRRTMPSPSHVRNAITRRKKRKQTQTQSTQTPAAELTLEESYDPDCLCCPVCMEDKSETKFIWCRNDHSVCIECLRHPSLIKDEGECNAPQCGCTGFMWVCPICRDESGLMRPAALAVMQGHVLNVRHARMSAVIDAILEEHPNTIEVIQSGMGIGEHRWKRTT